jgi:hypothetical protein
MEREIRTWWNELTRADQDAWISAWEADEVTPEALLTLPVERSDRWTIGDQPMRPSPQLADFLEQQAAGRFLNAGRPPRRPEP